jgi:hypothetical protein
MSATVWMRPPNGGAPEEVAATGEALTPLMVRGWIQCQQPEPAEESSVSEPDEQED